jgi:hypothetical protein
VLVREVLAVVENVPLGVDATSAADNTRHAFHCQRDVPEQDAGVNREVVDALFGLLHQSLAEHLPRQIFGNPVHLFQRLVNGDGPDGDGRVADDPLAGLVNVLSGRQVHEGVGPPQHAPLQLLDFLFDAGRDGAVANVGVDLDLEHAADELRLQLEVVLVAANDGPAAGHFTADQFGVDIFAGGAVQHFFRDDVLAGKVHLRVPLVLALALLDPLLADLGQPDFGIDVAGTARVVQIQKGLVGIFEVDATERDLQHVSRRLVNHLLVLLGRLGKGLGVRDRVDPFELRIKRVLGGRRPLGGLDVGLLGDPLG